MRSSSAVPAIAFVANISTAAIVPLPITTTVSYTGSASISSAAAFSVLDSQLSTTTTESSPAVPTESDVTSSALDLDSSLGYFYGFLDERCPTLTGGLWTLGQFNNGTCAQAGEISLKSISLEEIEPGCKLELYNDQECSYPAGGVRIAVHACITASPTFNSWLVNCTTT